jgi:hypothetical protein
MSNGSSNTLNEQLIELHLKYELDRLSPDAIEKDIALEVDAFLLLAEKTKLKEIISIEQLKELNLPQVHGSQNLDKAIKHIVLAIYNDKIHEKTNLGDLVKQEELDEVIDSVLSFNELREQLLSDAINSNIAREIIADLLYSGISRYISMTNEITKKVPGAKAMMKMGKGIMNRAAPALEDRVESQIKKTINIALPDILAQSEKFISHSITDEGVKDIVISVWKGLKDQPIASARKHIDEESMEELSDMILGQIHRANEAHTEQTPQILNTYIHTMYESGLKAFYKEYANKKLNVLMKDIGIDAEVINQALNPLLSSLIENLKETGYLEERLRARLTDFYTSEATQKLLAPR